MKGIVMILFLTILIPVIVYNELPDWTFYLTSATRLWLAADDIESSYGTDSFFDKLQNVEKKYDSNIEIYTNDGRFIYATADFIDSLPADLNKAPTVDNKYKLNYETVDGEISAAGRGFIQYYARRRVC